MKSTIWNCENHLRPKVEAICWRQQISERSWSSWYYGASMSVLACLHLDYCMKDTSAIFFKPPIFWLWFYLNSYSIFFLSLFITRTLNSHVLLEQDRLWKTTLVKERRHYSNHKDQGTRIHRQLGAITCLYCHKLEWSDFNHRLGCKIDLDLSPEYALESFLCLTLLAMAWMVNVLIRVL